MDKPTPPPAAPPKKFAPRAGIQRKTKAEREQYGGEEEARLKQLSAEATLGGPSNSAADGRSRGRGRGGSTAVNAADRVRSEGSGGVFGAAIVGGGAGRGSGGGLQGEGLSEVIADLAGLDESKESVLGRVGSGMEEEEKM